jgi:hypothetical protein
MQGIASRKYYKQNVNVISTIDSVLNSIYFTAIWDLEFVGITQSHGWLPAAGLTINSLESRDLLDWRVRSA